MNVLLPLNYFSLNSNYLDILPRFMIFVLFKVRNPDFGLVTGSLLIFMTLFPQSEAYHVYFEILIVRIIYLFLLNLTLPTNRILFKARLDLT